LLETADRILAFDAVESGGEPGAVYIFRLGDVLKTERHDSLHAMELIQVLRTFQHPPEEVVIIGVESGARGWGTELSPVLHAAIPNMISMAQNVIQYFNYLEIPLAPRFDSRPLTPDMAFAGVGF
jgi:hydrogenase maturation protease